MRCNLATSYLFSGYYNCLSCKCCTLSVECCCCWCCCGLTVGCCRCCVYSYGRRRGRQPQARPYEPVTPQRYLFQGEEEDMSTADASDAAREASRQHRKLTRYQRTFGATCSSRRRHQQSRRQQSSPLHRRHRRRRRRRRRRRCGQYPLSGISQRPSRRRRRRRFLRQHRSSSSSSCC